MLMYLLLMLVSILEALGLTLLINLLLVVLHWIAILLNFH